MVVKLCTKWESGTVLVVEPEAQKGVSALKIKGGRLWIYGSVMNYLKLLLVLATPRMITHISVLDES